MTVQNITNVTDTSGNNSTPFLCVEHDFITEIVIATLSILFLIATLAAVVCLLCKRRAERQRLMTKRLKEQLDAETTALHTVVTGTSFADDDESCIKLSPAAISRRHTSLDEDYSSLADASDIEELTT